MADDFISSATSSETALLHVKRDKSMYFVTQLSSFILSKPIKYKIKRTCSLALHKRNTRH